MPNLPEPAAKQPPNRPWAVLKAVLLTALAMIGIGMAWFGLGPTGSVGGSSQQSAGDSSAIPPASSVTPVTFAEVATLIAMERASPDPALTPEPMAVWLADAPLPTFTPTPFPATATIVAQLTAVAHSNATATAAARPRSCYETVPGQGRSCWWPTNTPVPQPTWTPLPVCGTPVGGEFCIR